MNSALQTILAREGYTDLYVVDGANCGLLKFVFTTGLVVGLTEDSYQRRYCYEHAQDAKDALAAWDGREHPTGPWIKCKGLGIDLLNPNFGQEDSRPRCRSA